MKIEEINLLFVDDEIDIVDIAIDSLTLEGINAKGATSPKEALVKLSTEKFHVILSDLTMPGMTGQQFLQEVRKLYGNEHFFMFATGQVELQEADFIKMGADGLLPKPFKFSEIVERVKKHFNIP